MGPAFNSAHTRAPIAQIRADIETAWQHVEAGRAILARSAWLIERWRAQALAGEPALVPKHASVAGEFIVLEDEPQSKRRRIATHRQAA